MNTLNSRPIQILLVEDSPSDAKLTLTALKLAKVANEVSHVVDGVEAIDFLRRTGKYGEAPRPDVLAEIKFDPDLKLIPVVIMTTSQAEQDVMQSYQLHANCYITKPVNFDRFMEVVKSIENFWLSVIVLPTRV